MIEVMKKYFIPNEKNEYVPHFFRRSTLALLSLVAVIVFFGGIIHLELIQKTDLLSAVIPKVIVNLTNTNRSSLNLDPLVTSPILEDAAQRKANHMATYGYFAHNSPDGVTPWHWFKEAGYEYMYAGENLAVNFSDSENVDKAWMNSPTHRANIVNGRFTEIGVATARGMYKGKETVFVVQLFGKPLPGFAKKILELRKQEAMQMGIGGATTTKLTATTSSPIITQKLPRVLGESGFFLSTINEDIDSDLVNQIAQNETRESETNLTQKTNIVEKLAASPKKTIDVFYTSLAAIIVISLVLFIGIEIRRQSPKHIILGLALLALVLFLGYVFQGVFFEEVIVM